MPPRAVKAQKVRVEAAQFARNQAHPLNQSNGDETRYPERTGSFSKGLPHNQLGEVDSQAYDTLLGAFASGDPAVFEGITLSPEVNCPNGRRRLTNPQAGLSFDLEGPDPQACAMPPAPPVRQRRRGRGDGRTVLDGAAAGCAFRRLQQ